MVAFYSSALDGVAANPALPPGEMAMVMDEAGVPPPSPALISALL